MRDKRTINQLILICDYTAQAIDGLLNGTTAKVVSAKQNILHIEEALITEKEDNERENENKNKNVIGECK